MTRTHVDNGSALLSCLTATVLLSACPGAFGDAAEAARERWLADDAASRLPARRQFFVRANGDDANSGLSPSESWRSIERVNAQQLEPGDHVLFEAGCSFEGTLRLDALDGGDPTRPVRVSSFGVGRAWLRAGAGDGIVVSDASGVVIERLRLEGGWNVAQQAGNEGEGISAIGSSSGQRRQYLRLRELEISGFKYAGIGLHARPADDSKQSGWNDVAISDSELHDNADFGLLSDGPYLYDKPGYSHADVRVRRVRSHHNLGLSNKGAHTGSGITLSDVEGALIEHCIAHDNGALNDNPGGGGYGIWAWDSDRVVIQYNEAYANETMTADGGGFDLDGGVTNSVMQYNYSHDNDGAGYGAFQFEWARPFDRNVVQYNISQNDGYGFLIWDGNGDMGALAIAQNTGYGMEAALITFSPLADVSVLNNVFYGVGAVLFDVYDGAGMSLQGNNYWTGSSALQIAWDTGTAAPRVFTDFDAYRAATGQETLDGAASGQFSDPRLTAAGSGATLDDTARLASLTMYQLRDDSPLIDRGVDPARFGIELASRDFFGGRVPRGAGRDVGAHER